MEKWIVLIYILVGFLIAFKDTNIIKDSYTKMYERMVKKKPLEESSSKWLTSEEILKLKIGDRVVVDRRVYIVDHFTERDTPVAIPDTNKVQKGLSLNLYWLNAFGTRVERFRYNQTYTMHEGDEL